MQLFNESILHTLLAAIGLAADTKGRRGASTASKPPRGIGSLSVSDPIALGDFTFDLMQADGKGEGDAFAKKHGLKNKDKAEDAIQRIRFYNGSNPAFGEAVNSRVAERTQQLMDQIATDPAAIAQSYQGYGA